MFSYPSYAFVIIFVACWVDAAKLPKNWKACKVDNHLNTCLKDSFDQVIPDLVNGIPNLGIPPLDPLRLETLTLGKGAGPVNLDLGFKNLDIIGLKDLKVTSVDTDWKTMSVEGHVPRLLLKGEYFAEGKVMMLPVVGRGDCEIDIDMFKAHVVMHISEKTKNNKKYYHVDKLDIQFDCDKVKMRFDKLFSGDKILGEQLNAFLNENWRDLQEALKPMIASSFSIAWSDIANRVFSKVPKDQISPA